MKKNNLVLIGVLAVIVLIAGVQLFQFNALTDNIGNIKTSGTAPATSSPSLSSSSSSSGSGNLPGVLSNLPSQVGGC